MTKYNEFFNEETGEMGFSFTAKLLRLGETILQNSNETNYKIAEVKFMLPSGEEVERTAMVYEKNYEHGLEVGKNYLTTVTFDEVDGTPYLRMSHLQNVQRASAADFAGLFQSKKQLIEDDSVM
ncbi:hypothetical protein [Altibacter sp. HG106]|uniref:hypothetical protein n=1 Tax=Altibacter sp. HG106 TaxID=3023937 RepID=UPI00234FC365|nr:hypothetical protein [Altibacter sp. HG106]MDC7994034.1 hypothetical protein [Altibacter sp. HG106]